MGLFLLIMSVRWGIDWAAVQANLNNHAAEQILFLIVILLFFSTLGYDLVIGKTHIHSECLLKLAYLPVSRKRFNAWVILISFVDLWSLMLLVIFGGLYVFSTSNVLFAFLMALSMVLFFRSCALFWETLLTGIYNRISGFYLYTSIIILLILVKSGLLRSLYQPVLQDTSQFLLVHAHKVVMTFVDNLSTGAFAGHFIILLVSSALFIFGVAGLRDTLSRPRSSRFFSLLWPHRYHQSLHASFILHLTKELQFMIRCKRFTWMVPVLLIMFMLPLDYYRQRYFLAHAQLFLLFTMPFSVDMGFLFYAEGRAFANYRFLPVSMKTVVWAKQGAYMIFFYTLLIIMMILFQWLVVQIPLIEIIMIMLLMTAFFLSSLAWQNRFLSHDFKHIDFSALFEKTYSGSGIILGIFVLMTVYFVLGVAFEFSQRYAFAAGWGWLVVAAVAYFISLRSCTRELYSKFSNSLSVERG
ncbi:hypothetical protein GF406_12645 [candidate division KSB1 bacterium]|nr:hypothetical protein [candidate division KSB1 bacterium]